MATGDKVVTLDGLKAVFDYQEAEVSDLKSAINEVASAGEIIVNTDSVPVVTVDDAAVAPVKAMDISIVPIMSGSGDVTPDNIRSISGWTAVSTTRTGKNVIDSSVFSNATATEKRVTLKLKPNSQYMASTTCPLVNGGACLFFLLEGQNISTGTNGLYSTQNRRLNTGDDGIATVAYRTYGNVDAQALAAYNTQIELVETGGSATEYEAYNGETNSINLPASAGTVYAGSVHINDDGTGTLSVTHKYIEINGSGNWTRNDDGSFFKRSSGISDGATSGVIVGWSNYMRVAFSASTTYLHIWPRADLDFITIVGGDVSTRWPTVASLQSALNSTPLQLVYQLATPLTYGLSASQITTLLGTNTIWSNAGNTSIKYVADTKTYIDNKIAEVQAMILENISNA